MGKVLNTILSRVRYPEGITQNEVEHILKAHHDELVDSWTGKPDNPGVLSRILLSGIAAGDAALTQGSAANPNRPVALKSGIAVNWMLLPKEAIDFIRNYGFGLVTRLDETTQKELQNVLIDWLNSGQSLDALKQQLTTVFQDEARAQAIAQTESTRAYFEGTKERYKQAGVKRAVWNTVNVGLKHTHKLSGDVCPICSPLHLQEFDLEQGAWSDVLGRYVYPPAHVNCRCWAKALPLDEQGKPINQGVPLGIKMSVNGIVPRDIVGKTDTPEALNDFIYKSPGQVASILKDPDVGLTQLNFDTDVYEVDKQQTKDRARQFVVESQNIQYGKDYLVSLAQEQALSNGLDVDDETALELYNKGYAAQAEAILAAAQAEDVKLTEAQQRRLDTAASGNYLDMVYTTDTSVSGSLANQTRRTVKYGGNFYATEAARKEARREFLDRLGQLDF